MNRERKKLRDNEEKRKGKERNKREIVWEERKKRYEPERKRANRLNPFLYSHYPDPVFLMNIFWIPKFLLNDILEFLEFLSKNKKI